MVITVNRRILCFGDSNTYGYDPRSYLGGRYPASVRWTALLKTGGWEVANAGENGRCIPRLEQDAKLLSKAALRTDSEIVTIMLGSNDLLQQPVPSAEVCAERMEWFLTALLQEMRPSCQVLLAAPPPMKLGAWVSDPGTLVESQRLAGCYKTLAQRLGIHFADAGNWGVELAFDGVHFSEQGHRAFADGIRKKLEQIAPLASDMC